MLYREQDRNFCFTSIELVVLVYIRASGSAYKIWSGTYIAKGVHILYKHTHIHAKHATLGRPRVYFSRKFLLSHYDLTS